MLQLLCLVRYTNLGVQFSLTLEIFLLGVDVTCFVRHISPGTKADAAVA